MNHRVKIINKEPLNHDVIRFRLERPSGYEFLAGQATELFIDYPQKHGPGPFTFTGLNREPYLELTIKVYAEHHGLTAALSKLNPGDDVIITDAWDSFFDKGPGIFLAGGAGITPFIALLRQMREDRTIANSYLYFSNKTRKDIFMQDELKEMLGERYVDVITQEKSEYERIDDQLLSKHIGTKQPYYVCGPPGFVESVQTLLQKIGAAEDMVNVSL